MISKTSRKANPGSGPVAVKSDTRRATPPAVGRSHEPTPIGPSLHIKGEITGNEDLVVYGRVEGRIDIGEGLLLVTKEGRIDADANARVITIEGRAEGDLRAAEQIIVRRSARVRGSIAAPRIALDFGCAFTGTVDTDVEQPAEAGEKIADFKAAISGTGQSGAQSSRG